MKNITALLIFCCLLISCEKSDDDSVAEMPFQPEPFERVFTSFTLPELGIVFDEENYCRDFNILQESREDEGRGFEYVSGIDYEFLNNPLSEVSVRFRIRVFEDAVPGRMTLVYLKGICRQNPEQCFSNLAIKYDDVWYTSTKYEFWPFSQEVKDINAEYRTYFRSELTQMECFENRTLLPTRFEFSGYLYNTERTDSLRVEDVYSQFWSLE